ncbi:normocyte binding protein, putative [Babesia ovata]|uniref:Normocyte binding protein, putative n=1 Tax=Babesia ovata TaxID=189622 RepID=A0A2H6K698_9APIC|nr:normocyte binding protein, putative [Babesia ovata]GBE58517.1 normocyte binding protein, putative [Babesia ovata]
MAITFTLSKKATGSGGEPQKNDSARAASTSVPAKRPSVFGADSDSDGSASDSLGSHPLSKRAKVSQNAVSGAKTDSRTANSSIASEKKPVKVTYKEYDLSTENLAPELYLYDELEDESNKEARDRTDPSRLVYLGCAPSEPADKAAPTVEKDSQYMQKLLRTARDRRMERDIAFDKQQLKADLESGESVGEVFVTGAYKRQLEERRRFEEEQRLKDEADLKASGKSVASFHAHMLKSGIASRTNRKT